MNQRIQELAEQANEWYPQGYPSAEGGPRYGADCADCHPIRLAFEQVSVPNFQDPDGNARDQTGQYVSDVLKDHWETFQEGWEECLQYLKNRKNEEYSDIVSDGGMDPRN